MSLEAKVERDGSCAVVDFDGKITIGGGARVLRERVEELLAAGVRRVSLRLERVSYMDSAGLSELIACYRRARELGGTIELVAPSSKVRELLRTTRLSEIFPTRDDHRPQRCA